MSAPKVELQNATATIWNGTTLLFQEPKTENVVIVETKRGRGRPKGSKNKPK